MILTVSLTFRRKVASVGDNAICIITLGFFPGKPKDSDRVVL